MNPHNMIHESQWIPMKLSINLIATWVKAMWAHFKGSYNNYWIRLVFAHMFPLNSRAPIVSANFISDGKATYGVASSNKVWPVLQQNVLWVCNGGSNYSRLRDGHNPVLFQSHLWLYSTGLILIFFILPIMLHFINNLHKWEWEMRNMILRTWRKAIA